MVTFLKCRNPTLVKCEEETRTPKVGDLESSRTPEFLEFDSKGQNILPWGVLGVFGKVLKCKCPKWPCIGHLDIYSPSYGQKKGRESNWQFTRLYDCVIRVNKLQMWFNQWLNPNYI
jgi:hypothetical protein